MRPPVVQARDLSRRFGRRWAFARISLDVQPGERWLVFGPNGAGKTTLLRTLATAIAPTLGELRLFGGRAIEARARVGMLGHSAGVYEDLSARDNLAFLARVGAARQADLAELLGRVGLEDRIDPVRRYSAGMRRRLAMAALMLKAPDLVLLDEPFAQLDPAGIADTERLIRGIEGTVIVASHHVERMAALCDKALLLVAGLPRWSGPASQAWTAWRMAMRAA